jgi:regulator of sirC expression with transglutaminase-like and TPR domain
VDNYCFIISPGFAILYIINKTALNETKEIAALLHLIDDPDEDVYGVVSTKILSIGKSIIPNLEHLWENTPEEGIQERIELIIHKLHFNDLTDDFINWRNSGADLLKGALLVARYHYPEFKEQQPLQEIEKLRRNIWLEMSSYLTPLEQANIITGIMYNYHKQQGVEVNYTQPDDFLVNKVLETKKGNAIGNGIVYLALCEMLDIPIRAVNIPKQFILAYFDPQYEMLNPLGHTSEKIVFFVDPVNGQIYSHKDLENYFKRIAVPPTPSYYKPLNSKRVIQMLLEELGKCFDNDKNRYKMDEQLFLANLTEE